MSEVPKLIAHVIYRLDIGGLENGLVNLINHIPDDRYRHAIICQRGYSADFRSRIKKPVEIFDIGKKDGHDIGMHVRLWRIFKRLRPDIVHTRNLATLEAAVPAAASGIGIRIHGEHGRDIGDLDGSNRKNRIIRRIYSPFVTRYIALSKDLESYLGEKVGISERKITQIYNGVDTLRFHPSKNKTPGKPVVIGTVGRMQPVKDQLTLVKAFIRLHELAPKFRGSLRLLIVGDGPLKNEAEALLQASGLADQASFPGARQDVPDLMREMDLFVLPSLAEGISNTILEAMATGLPVVATDVGGNPELVEDGITGFLVPRSDPEKMARSMLTYLADPDLLSRHSAAARLNAESRFSMDAMVNAYMRVYDDCTMKAGK